MRLIGHGLSRNEMSYKNEIRPTGHGLDRNAEMKWDHQLDTGQAKMKCHAEMKWN